MKAGGQIHIRVGLEALLMKKQMNAVTATDLALAEEVMKKFTERVAKTEKAQDMIKKVGNMVILGEVLPIPR